MLAHFATHPNKLFLALAKSHQPGGHSSLHADPAEFGARRTVKVIQTLPTGRAPGESSRIGLTDEDTPREIGKRIEGEQLRRRDSRGERGEVITRDAGSGCRCVADEQVGAGIAIEVFDRYADALRLVVGRVEEVGEFGELIVEQRGAVVDDDLRWCSGAAADHEVLLAVAVEVAPGDVASVAESVVEREEIADEFRSAVESEGGPIEDSDARTAAGPRREDQVTDAIAIDVSDCASAAAAEVHISHAIAADQRDEVRALIEASASGLEDTHAGTAAGFSRNDQVSQPVIIEVAGGDQNATIELGSERRNAENLSLGDAIKNADLAGASGAAGDGDVGDAVACEVRGGDSDAPRERITEWSQRESLRGIGVVKRGRAGAPLITADGELSKRLRTKRIHSHGEALARGRTGGIGHGHCNRCRADKSTRCGNQQTAVGSAAPEEDRRIGNQGRVRGFRGDGQARGVIIRIADGQGQRADVVTRRDGLVGDIADGRGCVGHIPKCEAAENQIVADWPNQRRGTASEVNDVQVASECCEGLIVGREDVEAIHAVGGDSERADGSQCAAGGGILGIQRAGRTVDDEERGRAGSREAIRVGRCCGGRVAGVQRRLCRGDARIRMHGQIDVRIADDSDAIHDGVEVKAEVRAGHGEYIANLRRGTRAGVNSDEPPVGAVDGQAVQSAIRWAEVDALNRFAGPEALDRDGGSDNAGGGRIKADKITRGRDCESLAGTDLAIANNQCRRAETAEVGGTRRRELEADRFDTLDDLIVKNRDGERGRGLIWPERQGQGFELEILTDRGCATVERDVHSRGVADGTAAGDSNGGGAGGLIDSRGGGREADLRRWSEGKPRHSRSAVAQIPHNDCQACAEGDFIKARYSADFQQCEGGVADAGLGCREDVESVDRGGIDTQVAHQDECAIVGRSLNVERVAVGIDDVELGRACTGEVVDVCRGRWFGRTRVDVAVSDDETVVWIDAKVLTCVADDAKAVGHRVEVDAEARAFESRERIRDVRGIRGERCNERGSTRRRVDREKPFLAADAVEKAVGRSIIDADESFAPGQSGDGDGRAGQRWCIRVEWDEIVSDQGERVRRCDDRLRFAVKEVIHHNHVIGRRFIGSDDDVARGDSDLGDDGVLGVIKDAEERKAAVRPRHQACGHVERPQCLPVPVEELHFRGQRNVNITKDDSEARSCGGSVGAGHEKGHVHDVSVDGREEALRTERIKERGIASVEIFEIERGLAGAVILGAAADLESAAGRSGWEAEECSSRRVHVEKVSREIVRGAFCGWDGVPVDFASQSSEATVRPGSCAAPQIVAEGITNRGDTRRIIGGPAAQNQGRDSPFFEIPKSRREELAKLARHDVRS